MAKTIKGSELIKALEEGKLKAGQQVKFTSTIAPRTKIAIVITKEEGLYLQDTDTKNVINTGWLINSNIEIIEEQQDIDKIKTLNPEEVYFKDGTELVYKLMYDKINEIAMRVNKINKNIKDKE